jgi:Alternative complex III, ActD subunit
MSDVKKIEAVLAEFKDPGDILHAAEKVRDAGFKEWDVHSPFPIHGMDGAMGEKRSPLGWMVGLAALIGVLVGIGMQGWMNAVDYKLVIAGKTFFSYQAFFPVTFALGVLFSVITAVFGMLSLNKLRYHHPVFHSENFERFSNDAFFISIMAEDKKFNNEKTPQFLEEIGGTNIELLEEK